MVNIINETIMNAKFMNPLPDSIEPTAEVSNVNVFEFPLSSIPCKKMVFPSKPLASMFIGI